MLTNECRECGRNDDQILIHKCPVCHKRVCEEHGHSRSGVWFCTKGCSEYFFFSEPDD